MRRRTRVWLSITLTVGVVVGGMGVAVLAMTGRVTHGNATPAVAAQGVLGWLSPWSEDNLDRFLGGDHKDDLVRRCAP